ncbi:MAG: hypothetical protein KF875_08810 [Trueperaceae bacterium]|nr:hypothetical protein [Trueperaceae bacterium]MCC6311537.1 hypothetical protein [Trueperaceae bacterium]MCO5175067.1 hypothetical protein [Trueperaceae bacterium]MCW5819321.1 hypothetical protein [Trueperaceae bacterium]
MLGAFVPAGVWNDLAPLRELEDRVGGAFGLAHWYTSWDFAYDPVPVDDVLAAGRIPLVTWQTHNEAFDDIVAGAYDAYIREWAHGVRAAAGTVYVRIFPEMNGEWTPWNGDPEGLKRAWRHIVELFAAEDATNVRWVFSPNVTDEPRTPENAMERYYPGDDYVDVLGLDGYNWGETKPLIGWRSYEDVFKDGYARITRLGGQPLWLAEVASAEGEKAGDKAAWVDDMLNSTAFPRVEAIVWFNEDKEADWRIESSLLSLQAFRSYFRSRQGAESPQAARAPAAPARAQPIAVRTGTDVAVAAPAGGTRPSSSAGAGGRPASSTTVFAGGEHHALGR